jgi:hypothetical protein
MVLDPKPLALGVKIRTASEFEVKVVLSSDCRKPLGVAGLTLQLKVVMLTANTGTGTSNNRVSTP